MTNQRLGVLAFTLLAVYCLFEVIRSVPLCIFWASTTGDSAAMFGGAIVILVAGLALLRWRVALSTWLFGGDSAAVDDPVEGGSGIIDPSLLDIQIVGLALLGVWQVAAGLPGLVRQAWLGEAVFDVDALQWLEVLLPLAIGAFLILRGELVARLWAPRLRTGAAGGSS